MSDVEEDVQPSHGAQGKAHTVVATKKKQSSIASSSGSVSQASTGTAGTGTSSTAAAMSALRIPVKPLGTSNYRQWRTLMALQLKRLNLSWTVENRSTRSDTAEQTESRQYALLYLSSNIEDERVLDMLDRYSDPYLLWLAIERRHTPVSRQESRAIIAELYSVKQGESERVDDYISRIYKLRTQYLRCGGIPAAADEGMMAAMTIGTVEYIRNGVGAREVSWKQSSGTEPTFDDVCEWASAMESTRLASKHTHSPAAEGYAGAVHTQKSKTSECHNCKKSGHFARDCPDIDRLTASADQVKQGWCPLKGHVRHKASDCHTGKTPPKHAERSTGKLADGLFDEDLAGEI